MDATLTDYFAAWNETDQRERGRLLQRYVPRSTACR
jgi:hypothetical protein